MGISAEPGDLILLLGSTSLSALTPSSIRDTLIYRTGIFLSSGTYVGTFRLTDLYASPDIHSIGGDDEVSKGVMKTLLGDDVRNMFGFCEQTPQYHRFSVESLMDELGEPKPMSDFAIRNGDLVVLFGDPKCSGAEFEREFMAFGFACLPRDCPPILTNIYEISTLPNEVALDATRIMAGVATASPIDTRLFVSHYNLGQIDDFLASKFLAGKKPITAFSFVGEYDGSIPCGGCGAPLKQNPGHPFSYNCNYCGNGYTIGKELKEIRTVPSRQ